jgi:hypothetical protein
MNGDDRARRVILAGEQHAGFQLRQIRGQRLHVALDIRGDVFALAAQLKHGIEVGYLRGNLRVLHHLLFQALALLHELLAFFGIRPEIRRVDLIFGGG